ncbi:Dihydroxyacetone synthase [Tulasnella sp. UAMH 9824]|nr:Dihydroxyacetone synthase [Tulasnella sp. UAMH 9824]
MRPSRVFNLIAGLLPALPHLISAASLPPPTRSVNPLVSRDLSVEAQVCADVEANISVWTLGGLLEVDISLEVCLCVHAVVQYVNDRNDIPADCKDEARQKIISLIKNDASRVQCDYPANCYPTSSICSSSDKCACSCEPGYTKNPITGKCQCSEGTYSCHGECKPNTSPCPSAVPRRARSTNTNIGTGQHGQEEVEQGRRPHCPRGLTACGVEKRGGISLKGWGGIDTQTDLESCE